MPPDPIDRPIHNMAMAQHELQTVAILMSSIARLLWAMERHYVADRVHITLGSWAETLRCACGDYIDTDSSHPRGPHPFHDHVIEAARTDCE